MASDMSVSSDVLPQFQVVGWCGEITSTEAQFVAPALATVFSELRVDGNERIALSAPDTAAGATFARAALGQGVAWHALVSRPLAEWRDAVGEETWREVEVLIARAESVRIIVVGRRAIETEREIEYGVVEESDIVCAMAAAEPSAAVSYARELGRPLVLINPMTGEVRRENFEHLNANDPLLGELNATADAPLQAPDTQESEQALVWRFHAKINRVADTLTRRVRAVTTALVFIAAAGLIVTTAVAFSKIPAATGALVVAMAIAATLTLWWVHRQLHARWLRCRLAGEIVRSALATWGLPQLAALDDAFEFETVRALLRSLQLLHHRSTETRVPEFLAFRGSYCTQRIEDQLAYYRRQIEQARPRWFALHVGFWIALAAATVALLGALFGAFGSNALFLASVASIAGLGCAVSIKLHDLHRRVARYRDMVAGLESAARQLALCTSWPTLERVVQRTERALRQEVMDWHRRNVRPWRGNTGPLEAIAIDRTEILRRENRALAQLHQSERAGREAAELAEERARLEVLRYQLNPHFLFNALGSIAGLTLKQPEAAREVARRLAEFCRLTITRDPKDLVSLGDEFRMLGAYFEVQRAGWEPGTLATELTLPPAIAEEKVPGFLLLPLVENAVKYGGATSALPLRIRVAAQRESAGAITIEIANTGRWIAPGADHGAIPSTRIGLNNLRQRLARVYHGAHELDVENLDGWVRVTLRLRVDASMRP